MVTYEFSKNKMASFWKKVYKTIHKYWIVIFLTHGNQLKFTYT